MPSRHARKDLEHCRRSVPTDHEWACFAAHQAAEKAVKALVQGLGGEARGHAVVFMLRHLPDTLEVPAGVVESARRLDKHYIPTRYPNGFDAGAPLDY
jgi:HEPN domain-containing protein